MPAGIYLEIDTSELNHEIDRLRNNLTEERFERVMWGTFQRTGNRVKRILKTDIPQKYEIKGAEVGNAIHSAKVSHGGGGLSCVIPVVGPRKTIGGTFRARGGAHGWNTLKGRRYKVSAKIVKSNVSVLPAAMDSYGGQPPFRNLSATKLKNIAFTRAGKSRLPIMKIQGIAVPQMPMNRSEEEVQNDILEYMRGRVEHDIWRLLGG